MSRFRLILPLLLLTGLAACGGEKIWAPDDAVARAAYVHGGPPSITLVTVINNGNGSGGHSALVINAQQRVAFDPAGNFKSPKAPERNDFVYGMNPKMLRAYYGFHARTEWHVVLQEVVVTPEVAEIAYQLTKNYGAVPSAYCANSVSTILGQVPGFEDVGHSLYPKKIMKNFDLVAGVKTSKIFEDD
jgi:hypothetical protein